MTIESTFYTAISGDAGVTALVGSKITALVADPDSAPPYITYQVVSTAAHNLTKGAPPSERKIIQVNCISNTYEEAKSVAEAVKASVNASTAYLQGEGDDYFKETQNYRVRLDFSLIG